MIMMYFIEIDIFSCSLFSVLQCVLLHSVHVSAAYRSVLYVVLFIIFLGLVQVCLSINSVLQYPSIGIQFCKYFSCFTCSTSLLFINKFTLQLPVQDMHITLIFFTFIFMPYSCVLLFKLSVIYCKTLAMGQHCYGTLLLCCQHISPYLLTHHQPRCQFLISNGLPNQSFVIDVVQQRRQRASLSNSYSSCKFFVPSYAHSEECSLFQIQTYNQTSVSPATAVSFSILISLIQLTLSNFFVLNKAHLNYCIMFQASVAQYSQCCYSVSSA